MKKSTPPVKKVIRQWDIHQVIKPIMAVDTRSRLGVDFDSPKFNKLPSALGLENFLRSRTDEICLLDAIVEKKSVKRSFQHLHHEKRRRAQSYNPYRIPKEFRKVDSFISSPPKRTHRNRKDRRRPSDLLQNKTKQPEGTWLGTHIWHAKRMQMKPYWGFSLAHSAYQKNERKLYRYSIRHATIYEKSYERVVEIISHNLELLETTVTTILHNYSFNNKTGTTMVDGFLVCPLNKRTICPTKSLFLPKKNRLWVWIHPSCWDDAVISIIQQLYELFGISKDLETELKTEKIFSIVKEAKIQQTPIIQLPEFSVSSKGNRLCYWELHGRRAANILGFALHLPKPAINPDIVEDIFSQFKTGPTVWPSSGSCMEVAIKHPNVLGPLPPDIKRLRKLIFQGPDVFDIEDSPEWAISWPADTVKGNFSSAGETSCTRLHLNSSTRRSTKRKSLSKLITQLQKKRDNFSISKTKTPPFHVPPNTTRSTAIPVLLVFFGGESPGITVIMPQSEASKLLWEILTRCGCRAIGLQQYLKAGIEWENLRFPWSCPESEAAERETKREAQELKEKHFKRPPAHRPNYDLLETASPFEPCWKICFRGNNPQHSLDSGFFSCLRGSAVFSFIEYLKNHRTSKEAFLGDPYQNCLVPVIVEPVQVGVPRPNSMIYFPTRKQLAKYFSYCVLTRDEKGGGENTKRMKIVPSTHRKNVCRLLRKRRESFCEEFEEFHNPLIFDDEELSPKIVGYVIQGHHSLFRGKGVGMGFVAAGSFLNPVRTQMVYFEDFVRKKSEHRYDLPLLCWFRNADSSDFYEAWLTINPN